MLTARLFLVSLIGVAPLLGAGCATARVPNVSEADTVPVLRPPAAEHFVVGPGDVIDIKVWRQKDMDMQVTIAPDGAITYPLVGRIEVAGMSYPELVDALEDDADVQRVTSNFEASDEVMGQL